MNEPQTVRVGNLEFNVLDRGTGMPLLLVHGFPLNHTMWHDQIDVLSRHYRVIAPDLRGFGASSVTRGTISMETMAEDLAGVLDALEVTEPICFCGLSMGGYVAWPFWRNYADRLASLILCDTRAAADGDAVARGRMQMAASVLTEGTAGVAQTMLPKLFCPASLEHRPKIIDQVRRSIFFTSPVGFAAAQQGMAKRRDATALLPKINVPVLVVVGEHDTISPVDEMRTIAEQIPDARLVVVPEAGHLSPLENPAVFNAAVREFLG